MVETNPDYSIGGLGPNTNSTYGYFQYIIADELTADNTGYFNKSITLNNSLVKGVVKTTNVFIGTFTDPNDIYDSGFTESYRLSDMYSDLQQAKSDISTLQGQVSSLQSDLSSHSH